MVTIIARVTMKGCRRPLTMIAPLSAPTASPTQETAIRTPGMPNWLPAWEASQSVNRPATTMPAATGSQTAESADLRRLGWIGVDVAADLPVPTCPEMKETIRATPTIATRKVMGRAMPAATVKPGCVSSNAASTVPRARIEPTDRSMPPIRITMVMPTATRPVIETWRSTSERLPEVRKMFRPLEVTGEKATPIAKRAARPQYSLVLDRSLRKVIDGSLAAYWGQAGGAECP